MTLARLHRLAPWLSLPLLAMGLSGAVLLGRGWWREGHPSVPTTRIPEAVATRLRTEGIAALGRLGEELALGVRLRSAYLFQRQGEARWSLELELGGKRLLAMYTPADGKLAPRSEVSGWESELGAWHSGARGGAWRLLPLVGLLSLLALSATGFARRLR